MKKNFSKASFVAGVLATTVVFSLATPALAYGSKTAQLIYNNIKIRLNGTQLHLTDATGKAVEPFIIDGTTYLPVRAVGEALGLDVGWIGETNTVTLDAASAQKPSTSVSGEPAMWLGEMSTFTGKHFYDAGSNEYNRLHLLTANDGSTYENYYQTIFTADYLLNGDYSTFTGTIYLTESDKNDDYWQTRYVVLLDDKVVFTSNAFSQGDYPEDFTVNVSGAKKMTIIQQDDAINDKDDTWEPSNQRVVIGEAALWN